MSGALWIVLPIYVCVLCVFSLGGSNTDNMDVFSIGNVTYFLSRDLVEHSNVSKACEDRGLSQLFIQSNEEFFLLRNLISDDPSLDDAIFWVITRQTGHASHEWENEDIIISEGAWMILEHRGKVEPNGYGNGCENTECCVYLSVGWGDIATSVDERHYLMDNRCDQDFRYICVEALPVETTTVSTIPPTTTSTTTTTPTTPPTTPPPPPTTTTTPPTTPTTPPPTTTTTTTTPTTPTTTATPTTTEVTTTPTTPTTTPTTTTTTTMTPPTTDVTKTTSTTTTMTPPTTEVTKTTSTTTTTTKPPLSSTTSTTTTPPPSTCVPTTTGCPCSCRTEVNLNPSPIQLQTMVDEIHKELTVSKVTLSATRNKKESAADGRTSSVSMGVFAVSISVMPLIVMVLLDLNRLLQFLSSFWNKRNCVRSNVRSL